MKKTLTLLLTLILMLCMTVPTFATEASIAPRDSSYFSNYGTTLSAEEDGVIKITFTATGLRINNSIGVATYHVERLNANGVWESVTGLRNGETGSNVIGYTFSRYFQGVPGETYRVQVTFFCSNSLGSEFKTYTSGRITATR